MISWLKKHFVPHAGNNHRPQILRKENIRNITFIVILFELFVFLLPVLMQINMSGGMAAVLPAVLADLTNEERVSGHLNTLTTNPALNQAATMKANDMATKGYFAHTSPEGKTPWYWLKEVGYNYKYAGENLAINFSDSKDVTKAWMNSPTHRANIEKENYTEVGTGVALGIYKGQEAIFVAQVYASPLSVTSVNSSSNSVVSPKNQNKIDTIKNDNKNKKEDVLPAYDEKMNVLGVETIENEVKTDAQLNAQPELNNKPTFIQKIMASPRNSMNIILFVLLVLVSIPLLMYTIYEARRHHIDLITNGLVVIAIIGAIFAANYYISQKNMVTTSSLDYVYQEGN